MKELFIFLLRLGEGIIVDFLINISAPQMFSSNLVKNFTMGTKLGPLDDENLGSTRPGRPSPASH